MISLSQSRRKALKHLKGLGFETRQGKGDHVVLYAPDGTLLGSFSPPRLNPHTPKRMVALVHRWERGTR